jgi:hypothetical protein
MGVKGLHSAVDHPPLSNIEVRNKRDIDILKLKNCLYTTIIYLDVKGRLLHVSACGHHQVGSLDF